MRPPRNDFARVAPMNLKMRKSLEIKERIARFMGRIAVTGPARPHFEQQLVICRGNPASLLHGGALVQKLDSEAVQELYVFIRIMIPYPAVLQIERLGRLVSYETPNLSLSNRRSQWSGIAFSGGLFRARHHF